MDEFSLEHLLQRTPKSLLSEIALAHQLTTPYANKAELVRELSARLREPQTAQKALASLPAPVAELFERIRRFGGHVYTVTLRREMAQASSAGEQSPRGTRDNFGELVWQLLTRGLVMSPVGRWLPLSADNISQHNVELVIPQELRDTVGELRRPLRTFDDGDIESRADSSAQNFQRDVYLYWNYLRDQPLTLTSNGLVPKRHLLRLNDAMILKSDPKAMRDERSAARLHFIRLMLEESGLIKNAARRLEPSSTAGDFFRYSVTRRTDRIFGSWRKSTRWNELQHLPIVPRALEARGARALQFVVRARLYVLDLIKQGAAGGWMTVEDLLERARRENYEFLFKRTREDFGEVNPYYYYHNPLGWGFPVADEREGWDKVESEVIRCIIAQPLYWLGLVSLGFSNGRLVAFQFNALGAYLFGLSPQAPGDESVSGGGRVVVQPNFQVFALEPIAEQSLAVLDRFADRVKADRVFEYRLSRESLYRAQQTGMPVGEAIAFLRKAAAAPLPQNVLRTLEEWGQSYERIVVRRNVSLLHALDTEVLDALEAQPGMRGNVVSRPLPHVLITKNTSAAHDDLGQALDELGELPADATRRGSAEPQDALVLDDDGKVTLLHALPSIIFLRTLEEHAERADGGFQLTAAVVKAERGSGDSTDEILARWQQWHHGPMPPAIVVKIKRWGRLYGRAHNPELRTMRLAGAAVVNVLIADTEIGPYLEPDPVDPSSVIVAVEDAAKVSQMLEARGITVMNNPKGEASWN